MRATRVVSTAVNGVRGVAASIRPVYVAGVGMTPVTRGVPVRFVPTTATATTPG